MASTVWKGHLTFGLVSLPVRLIRAARAERIKLRQLYRKPSAALDTEAPRLPPFQPDRGPDIRQRAPQQIAATRAPAAEDRVAPPLQEQPPRPQEHVEPVRRVFQTAEDDSPAAAADLVKGYEYEKGQYVVLEEQDLHSLAPETSTEIQVVEFVRFEEIDPVYLENSYYILPDENAEKAYALLLEAMRQTGRAAIGQLTMHRRDHVLIVRPGKRGLIAHTMFYPDEVRSSEEFRTDTSLVASKELDLAKTLVEALAQPFDPARFKNAFRERLNALIESRIQGRETAQVASAEPAKVIDIMDALKRSLAQAEAAAKPAVRSEKADRKPAASEPRQQPARSEATGKRQNRKPR